jgi:hypothetical protein
MRRVWVTTGAAILALLAATSAAAAPVTPAAGATYRVGTSIQGVCDMSGGDAGFTYTTLLPKSPDGSWYPPKVGDSSQPPTYRISEGCTELLDSPGEYRVYLVHYDTRSAAEGGCGCVDQVILEAQFTVVAGGANPCEGKENQIVSVTTESGAPSDLQALQGSLLTAGQTLKADQNVTLTFGDGAILSLEQGSSFKIQGCDWTRQKEPTPFTVRLGLVLGAIWAKVSSKDEHLNVHTERVVIGNRGTTFWVSYLKGVTTVHVDSGSVVLTPVKGTWKAVTVTKGRTARQRGTAAPVVKKAPISNKPPF